MSYSPKALNKAIPQLVTTYWGVFINRQLFDSPKTLFFISRICLLSHPYYSKPAPCILSIAVGIIIQKVGKTLTPDWQSINQFPYYNDPLLSRLTDQYGIIRRLAEIGGRSNLVNKKNWGVSP